jgi:hypothetical protein
MKDKDLYKSIEDVRPRLEGWCSKDKAQALAAAVVDLKSETSVEIGVWGGKSLIALAMAHDFLEHGHCYGIDPWARESALHGVQELENIQWWSQVDFEEIFRGCMSALLEWRLTARCTVFRTTSEKAHSLFERQIDLLHIDGNHSEVASTLDVFLYLPKVRKGGLVFFDDVDWPSTKNALRLVEERCDKEREIVSNPGGVCAVYRVR